MSAPSENSSKFTRRYSSKPPSTSTYYSTANSSKDPRTPHISRRRCYSLGDSSPMCYTGKLLALLRHAQDPVFNAEVTKFCSVRLKLCFLEDKYAMVLLHNLAVDSICDFLGHAAELGLEWKVFKYWCRYEYEHSTQASSLRKFVTSYFHLAIKYSKEGK